MAEAGEVLALKNALSGAIAAADRLRELASSLQGMPDSTPISEVDLETLQRAALAHANAAMALRGLVEELRRHVSPESQ